MSQSLVGVVTCVLHKRRQTVTSFCSVLLQFGQLWGTSGGCDSSHFPAEDQGPAGDKPPVPAGISSSPFSTGGGESFPSSQPCQLPQTPPRDGLLSACISFY